MTVNASSLTRISVSTGGTSADNVATGGVMSADGRYVVFQSTATNLVGGDLNGFFDVFLRDTQTGTTTLISTATGGTQGNNVSSVAAVTHDGRYVFFNSTATNLVGGDGNAVLDVFMRDTQTGVTTRVSTTSVGGEANGASQNVDVTGNGAFIGFQSTATNLAAGDSNGFSDAFVKNLSTGVVTRISVADDESQANGNSLVTRLSDDGNRASFVSSASNLVATDTNGAVTDVFVRDIAAGTTTLVSVSTGGVSGDGTSFGSSISGNGRYVVFESNATNLVAGDTNGVTDIFVRDLQTNTTTRVSTAGGGSQGDALSSQASISADGLYVVFFSLASNLVQGDTNGLRDIFLKDTVTGTVTRLSVAADGTELNDLSNTPQISADGHYVTFQTQATDTGMGAEGNGTGFDVFRISLVAGAGADRMLGSDGNDTIDGLAGDDILLGGFGNDLLTGGAGADQISGAAGTDTASYAASATGVTVDLIAGTGTGGDAQGDTLSGIENLIGSAQSDQLYGDGNSNMLTGEEGNDNIVGGAGADDIDGGNGTDAAGYFNSSAAVTVELGAGTASGGDAAGDRLTSIENLGGSVFDDTLTGDIGANQINGGGGNDTIAGGVGNDTLYGGNGNDHADGGLGADTLTGGAGIDTLTGGVGNDAINGGEDADDINGGVGIDIADYNGSGVGVTVNLATGAGSGGYAEGDLLHAIENLQGSAFDDTLTGAGAANMLVGLNGNDVLDGGGGWDALYGGNGDDHLIGGDGGDILRGSAGADQLTGGADYDIASYWDSAVGVTINLQTQVNTGGAAQGDTIASDIETINGSNHDDVMTGNALGNALIGFDGDDILTGAGGNDTLRGGSGADVLNGGAGSDYFSYTAISDSTAAADDTIQDFQHGLDVISLSLIDADGNSGNGDTAFSFIGAADFSGTAGQLRYEIDSGTTTVSADVNGDGTADIVIHLDGAVTLQGSDFLL